HAEHRADSQDRSVSRAPSETLSERPLRRSLYPRGVGQALFTAARLRVGLWDRALRNVEDVQMRQLRRIVDHAKTTSFGRRHGFADLRTWEQYATRVPVGDYDSHS